MLRSCASLMFGTSRPRGRRRGDAEVDVVAHADLRAVVGVDPGGVDHRRAAHGPDHGARHDQQRRDLDVGEVRARSSAAGRAPSCGSRRRRSTPRRAARCTRLHHARCDAPCARRARGSTPRAPRPARADRRTRCGGGCRGSRHRHGDGLLADVAPLRRLDVAEHARLRRVLHDVFARDLAGRAAGRDIGEVDVRDRGRACGSAAWRRRRRMPRPARRSAWLAPTGLHVAGAAVADEHRSTAVASGSAGSPCSLWPDRRRRRRGVATDAAIVMIAAPTLTVSPSAASRSPTVPAKGEGSSTSDLAVSISTSTSLTATASPGATRHDTISASVRPSPTSGRRKV